MSRSNREAGYRRRIREKAEKDQREREKADAKNHISEITAAIHRIDQTLDRSGDETTPYKQSGRFWNRWSAIGLWAAAAVGLIAICVSSHDASQQYEILRADQRPWVGADYSAERVREGIRVMILVRSGGKSPALNTAARFRETALGVGGYKGTEVAKCTPDICSRSLLLPGGSMPYEITFPTADILTAQTSDTIFVIRGRMDYTDADGENYWTKTCWYYEKAFDSIVACPQGNEVGKGDG